ncbi:MAG: hypothetical protein AAF362_07745 [Pseudomonadota bacterium]
MPDSMEYIVQTEPDGRQYHVTALISGENAVMYCDCLAGKSGQMCKHRRALLDDDESLIIISASHPAELLRTAISRSNLGRSLDRLRYSEELLVRAQQLNSDEKARCAKIMNAEMKADDDRDNLERQLENQLAGELVEGDH